jgi:hypothetical protein
MPTFVRLEDIWALDPATILSIRMPNGIVHFGILTDEETVISASKLRGKVAEELPFEFSWGFPIQVHGRWGNQYWEDTIEIARANLGVEYHLFDTNCEHFVRFCSGLRPESPQLQRVVGAACLIGLAAWAIAASATS